MAEEEQQELSADTKNDILLAFNIFKNEKNKINKLKLRTLLFSFVMYKSSSSDINAFIEEHTSGEQEFFTYDEVCFLVQQKLSDSKYQDSEEIFHYVSGGHDTISEQDMQNAFSKNSVEVSPEEIKEMFRYMKEGRRNGKKKQEDDFEEDANTTKSQNKRITREQFQKFYTEKN